MVRARPPPLPLPPRRFRPAVRTSAGAKVVQQLFNAFCCQLSVEEKQPNEKEHLYLPFIADDRWTRSYTISYSKVVQQLFKGRPKVIFKVAQKWLKSRQANIQKSSNSYSKLFKSRQKVIQKSSNSYSKVVQKLFLKSPKSYWNVVTKSDFKVARKLLKSRQANIQKSSNSYSKVI